MRKSIIVAGICLVLAVSFTVAAPPEKPCKKQTVYTESFAGGELGEWWHHFNVVETDKGKHKQYIYSGEMTTHYPQARTEPIGVESEFTGNFADRNVVSFSIDLATIVHTGQYKTGYSPTLVLTSDSGTPDNIDDDCIVFYQSGEPMPEPDPTGVNWVNFTFEIPSASETLPQPNNGDPCPGGWCETCAPTGSSEDTQVPCWGVVKYNLCPTLDDLDLTWRNVIRDVDRIGVQWMSPEWFALILPWESAIDNPSIATCSE